MPRSVRIAIVAGLAGLLTATAIVIATDERPPRERPAAIPAAPDPIRAELRRCREIGAAALDDPACQTAWRAAREAFFADDPASGARP